MDVNLQSAGESQQALVSALSGQGTTTGQAIAIEGMDLNRFAQALSAETKPSDTLLGLWKGTTKGGVTAFDTLDGAFSVQNGVVNVSKMDLDGPRAAIKTTGRVDLLRWLLETAHEITLKDRPDVPPFTVKIAGPLDNPGQTFAQGALNDYLNRKINRKLEKLITDKLGLPSAQESAPAPQESQQQMDGGSGTQSQEQQAPHQQVPQEIKPEEALRGLLEGLLQ